MQNNICLHAINTNCEAYKSYKNIQVLTNILKTGALLSKRKRHLSQSDGFNGIDYICLCDYQKRYLHTNHFPFYNSFESYIMDNLSLVFPKDKLDIITPTIIDISFAKDNYYKTICNLGMSNERYSDLPDEVQVKDIIPLDLMCGLTIPTHKLRFPFYSSEKAAKVLIKDLTKIKELLIKYGYDVPIFDIDTMEELKDEVIIKKLVNKYY